MQIFYPIAVGNAAWRYQNDCQTMIHAHVENDLNRNEHLNVNLENKAPHWLLLLSPKITFISPIFKQVKSLTYLTSYGNL